MFYRGATSSVIIFQITFTSRCYLLYAAEGALNKGKALSPYNVINPLINVSFDYGLPPVSLLSFSLRENLLDAQKLRLIPKAIQMTTTL